MFNNFMSGRSGFYDDRCRGAAPPEFSPTNNGGDEAAADDHMEKEHMFDKVVTPSDVGKLNRLVIPKQYAEKYFPLDSSNNDKGLLLNFEDRNGTQWRFRYSYWNSSQSYVMTKGWSRFVKDKTLDAGDIVTFHRSSAQKERLFINWRRRPDAPPELRLPTCIFASRSPSSIPHAQYLSSNWDCIDPGLFLNTGPHYHQFSHNYPVVNGNPCPPGSIMYLRPSSGGGGGWAQAAESGQMVFESVPVVQLGNNASAKRLRLFGVTMDCPISHESDDDSDILSAHSTIIMPVIQNNSDNKGPKGSMSSLDFHI